MRHQNNHKGWSPFAKLFVLLDFWHSATAYKGYLQKPILFATLQFACVYNARLFILPKSVLKGHLSDKLER